VRPAVVSGTGICRECMAQGNAHTFWQEKKILEFVHLSKDTF